MGRSPARRGVAIVGIVKYEGPFVEEWVAYHRLLGADHFYLYDNDGEAPLASVLRDHREYVTVIPWAGEHEDLPGRNKQTKAYEHSLGRVREAWIAFIDVDEFIVLRQHVNLQEFLGGFGDIGDIGAVRLTWHLFGHNGYHDNPEGLITSSLTRRRTTPGRMTKAINRIEAISAIDSAHFCRLKRGFATVDANGRPYQAALYPGKTSVAHINHYMCRSFRNWMHRIERGEAAFSKDNYPEEHRWRFEYERCRRRFEELAPELNECVDEHMLVYREALTAYLRDIRGRPRQDEARAWPRRGPPAGAR